MEDPALEAAPSGQEAMLWAALPVPDPGPCTSIQAILEAILQLICRLPAAGRPCGVFRGSLSQNGRADACRLYLPLNLHGTHAGEHDDLEHRLYSMKEWKRRGPAKHPRCKAEEPYVRRLLDLQEPLHRHQ